MYRILTLRQRFLRINDEYIEKEASKKTIAKFGKRQKLSQKN